MRLLEVDVSAARDVLAVLQGQANKEGQPSTLPFPTVMKLLRPFDLGISSPDGLIALKNAVDPAGDVISDVLANGTIILKTTAENPNKEQPIKTGGSTPQVDAMASSNAKQLKPNI